MSIKYIDESLAYFTENLPYFNILVITATPLEKAELHKVLQPIDGRDGIITVPVKKQTYFLAQFGKYQIIHVACGDMGTIGRESATITASDAIASCSPKAVFMIGIAFGINRKKQKVGDLLVAERVIPYEPQKIGKDHEDRGKAGPAGITLLNRVRNVHDWEYLIGERQVGIQIGEVLTGEKLVDDVAFRDALLETYKLAIGGEMEGASIYAACEGNVKEWIMIKAICDFADGKKKINKKKNQLTAVGSALSFCEHLFGKPHVFVDLGIENTAELKKKSKVIATVNRLEQTNVIEYLDKQVTRQIKKQINSGKYLRDTFIETGDHKDHLRYCCHSIFYAEKCFEEARLMDFRMLNRRLLKRKKPAFEFDIWEFYAKDAKSIGSFPALIATVNEYLIAKHKDLESERMDSDERYTFTGKISRSRQDFEALGSRVALITEMAGQGKTNFLCDFAENFLLKAKVPTVFLTGAEIDAANIRLSILNKIFPETGPLTFEELLTRIGQLCEQDGKYFVIIVDGINESSNTRLLSKNLEAFVEEVLEYPFVKIVMSCRTEYYTTNFKNIEKSSFKDDVFRISSLLRHRHEGDVNKKLRETYFRHFNVSYNRLAPKADEQLSSNFLLLRIFCEAYQGQHFDLIDNIYKEELFEQYYSVKSEEINKRIAGNDEFQVTGNFDIRNFLEKLVELMIARRSYVNIPLDDIVSDPRHKQIYIRFLDENILVKRDLEANDKGVFTKKELVNFTFDEFRDFLISKYLLEKTYQEAPADFSDFLATQLTKRSPLEEGCSTFLFYAYRRLGDPVLNAIIETQPWFDRIFARCLFNLKDEDITENDKARLISSMKKGHPVAPDIIFNLMIRYNLDHYKNLSVEFLYDWLRGLNEDEYERFFSSCFGNRLHHFHKIDQDNLMSQFNKILEQAEEPFYYHKLFEVLIYMFLNDSSYEVAELYESYYFKFPDIAKAQLQVAQATVNERLLGEISLFLLEYEIQL